MANTTTSRYGFTKPEIGAATDTWGNLLNSNWDDADSQLLRKLDKTLVDGVSQTITIAQNNSRVTTATANGFQNVGVGDRIFISGSDASSGANNGVHTVTAIDTTNWLYVDCSGSTFVDDGPQSMTWGVVTKMKIDSSPGIDNTPVGANTASSGAFTTLTTSGNATVSGDLSVTGNSTLTGNTTVNGNTTLGNASTDTVTSNAKHGATTYTGQITSEVADGTPPFVVASTSSVANLKAAKADQWSTTRTIQLTGAVTSSATDIDGSGNVSIATTLADPVYSTGTLSNFLYEGSTQVTSGPSEYSCNWTRIGRVYHVQYNVVWNAANGQNMGVHTSTYQWSLALPASITNDMNERTNVLMYYGNPATFTILGTTSYYDYPPAYYTAMYYLRASDDRLVLYSHANVPYTRTQRTNNVLRCTITYQAI